MATTFTVAYKNKILNTLSGRASSAAILRYIRPCDGTQPADPDTTPVGTYAFSSVTSSIDVNGVMSNPGLGVTQMSAPRTAAAANTTGTLTFARIYDSSQVAMIDCTVGTSGTPGVILDSATASSGTSLGATGFTYKMPQTLSTVHLNADLVNALVQALWVTAGTVGIGINAALNIYSGTAPTNADTPLSGNTLLASIPIGSTSLWQSPSAGSALLTSNLSATALATGTATFARIVKGAMVLQGSVGTSSADFILDTVSLTSGSTLVTLTEATIAV